MPRWSTPVGCTKLALSIVILGLTAACCAIWGTYTAFGLSIFTASLSLVAFAYYLTALSFKPQLYNKWVVVSLESFLTLLWFVSLVLLAGWLGTSTAFPQWTWNVPVYGTPVYGDAGLDQRDLPVGTLDLWSSPLGLIKRQRPSSTSIRVHGQDAQDATRILAGISAGLAGINFVLYGITLITFSMNMSKPQSNALASHTATDEEAQTTTAPPPRTNTNNSIVQPGSPTPPSVTQPLRVDTLPKDFEPKPQTQEHYLTPEQAAEAGIEPPTPVLRAQAAEKQRESVALEKRKEQEQASTPQGSRDRSPVSPLQEKEE